LCYHPASFFNLQASQIFVDIFHPTPYQSNQQLCILHIPKEYCAIPAAFCTESDI
jgi:hypothetical protein